MLQDTVNINGKAKANNTYDAIVIGSGISGGWAAKELTERGLKTIMLERGRDFEHLKDYKSASKDPWDFEHRGNPTQMERKIRPVISRGWGAYEPIMDYWTNEQDAPYTEIKPFNWWRSYQLGGRSILWGRQSYRWSDHDFEANLKDGWAIDWPIRYKDIAPWYDHVEKFIGVNGSFEGLEQLPDGHFLPAMQMNCVEKDVSDRIKKHYNNTRHMIIGRSANLTAPISGRTNCQFRNRCWEGCPFGAYFSTQSSTLPAAMKTGNLTVRPFSIVTNILYDKNTEKANGVEIPDAETNQNYEYHAKVVFVNASALNSAWVLMNSATDIWPDGLGSSSGELGHNLMDHHLGVNAGGNVEGYDDKYYFGRRANGVYIPRFRTLNGEKRDYIRGFGYQGGAGREEWGRSIPEFSIGGQFKDALSEPGEWTMGIGGFGETLPYHENRTYLDKNKKDKWGLPVLAIDAIVRDNELKMRINMMNDEKEMLESAGVTKVETHTMEGVLGRGIHEMGTARMGR